MTPVLQTKFGLDGNCLSACVASVFDLPIQAVPEFSKQGWLLDLDRWFRLCGLRVYSLSAGRAELGIAIGPSPRGLRHAAVWQAGQVLHDPHPDSTGLSAEPDQFLYWERFRS